MRKALLTISSLFLFCFASQCGAQEANDQVPPQIAKKIWSNNNQVSRLKALRQVLQTEIDDIIASDDGIQHQLMQLDQQLGMQNKNNYAAVASITKNIDMLKRASAVYQNKVDALSDNYKANEGEISRLEGENFAIQNTE